MRAGPVRARGVGLVEVLVATLVLSFGFLMIARMQVDAMASQRVAYHESQALMLAGEMMDRMRNNLAGVAAGAYSDKSTSGSLVEPACVGTGFCSPAEIARADLFEWSARLQSMRSTPGYVPLLPPASDGSPAVGSIGAPTAAGVYPVGLAWKEIEGGEEVTREVVVRFAP